MTDYVLEITTWKGSAIGARHFRGTVKGPHPQSCHGAITFHGATGRTTCAEGHDIPPRAEWQGGEPWGEARYGRYAAAQFEGDGPGQFLDERALAEAARKRFPGEAEHGWWDEDYEPGGPGDRLYWEAVPWQVLPDDQAEEGWVREDAKRRAQGLPVMCDLVAEVARNAGYPEGRACCLMHRQVVTLQSWSAWWRHPGGTTCHSASPAVVRWLRGSDHRRGFRSLGPQRRLLEQAILQLGSRAPEKH